MKGVIGWIKGHLLVVICVVLILVFLPAGYVGANMWNSSIKQDAEDKFKKEQTGLRSKARVNYALPAVFEGEQSISDARAPNQQVTDFFAEQREARERQVARVVELATEFNAKGREPLVDGLLPQAPDDRARRRLTDEFVREISGRAAGDGQLPLFRRMLDRVNAGPPIAADALGDMLAEFERNERKRLEDASASGRLSPEKEQELRESLKRQRLGAYASRASELSFYAFQDSFRVARPGGGSPGEGGAVLEPNPAATGYTEEDAFGWQFDIWFIEDILAGLDRANHDELGVRTSVPESIVKRLETVTIVPFSPPSPDGAAQRGASGPASLTHTERSSTDVYDLRHATLTVVVSDTQIPALIDALGSANFLTVTGVRIAKVDVWADLQEGFYYGPGAVVRAEIDVEGAYLRDWTKQYMPPGLRERLGIGSDAAAAPAVDD